MAAITDAILNFERKEEDDFYALLGCDELSSTEQIMTEYKIRALALHPDKNADSTESAKKFSDLQRAKKVLTDPSLRSQYDHWHRSGIAIPFDDWMAKKNVVHMSMHWMGQKPKQPMLEETTSQATPVSKSGQDTQINKNPGQSIDPSKISNLFQSYKI